MTRVGWPPAAIVVALAACGGGGGGGTTPPPSSPAPASVERTLDPAALDPAVAASAGEFHVALNPAPSAPPAHRLFVFLPGTYGVPDQYRYILRAGAARGFHAIGLDYPNAVAVGVLCAGALDPDCFWNVRREIIGGEDLSPLVNVDRPNSILTRLVNAVAALDRDHPDEGWGQYLVGGTIDASKLVVSGHSQGGGHAGVMAKLMPLARACYFSSPADWDSRLGRPADWESRPAATPASAQFGLAGLSDPTVPGAQLATIWQTLGMAAFGAAVDAGAPSFGGSHMLTTNAAPQSAATAAAAGQPLHGLTVRDVFTPLGSDGRPLFDAAWGYLCFQ